MLRIDPTELHFAYFAYDPRDQILRLRAGAWRDTEGSSLDACSLDPDLWFPLGDTEGLVGHVAKVAQPAYVADCSADRHWADGYGVRSAFLIPLSDEGPCDVLVLVSHEIDGFDEAERALALALVRYLAVVFAADSRLGDRVRCLEHGLRRIALELSELGVDRKAGGARLHPDLSERLTLVSPREWQVLERLRGGVRVSAIARDLAISPNTVRNHLKALYRKLGVRSQAELLEVIEGRPSAAPQDAAA
jgi:DNA-binding CsgD family transcriptional regulator